MTTRRTCALALLVLCAVVAQETRAVTATAGQLVISEFRVRGPNGANDEFIEIRNASGADHTVDALSGSGYGVAASDGVTRCIIPNGTVIPVHGHYLCVNSVGYSLASYPAGNGTTATGDSTYTTNIPDNAGIAIFNNSTGGASYTLANRLDAVGSTSEANTLYKEGTGYPALVPFSIDYAFHRDACGKKGSITAFGPCPSGGLPVDTNDNANDFVFVDTNGTSAGAGQRLGAPGPENLSAPWSNGAPSFTAASLDPCAAVNSPPNRVRDFMSDPPNNSTFGTLDIRQTVTNATGGNITRLRFRIVDLTTFPAPSGIADLRPRTSTAVVVTVDRAPCGSGTSNVTVNGTTLEQPPSQPNGGGFNSSLSAGTVTLATPIANGASIDVRFLLGIQQTGYFRFAVEVEALPGGGSYVLFFSGHTEAVDLALTKNDGGITAQPGSTIPYALGYSNTGTSAAAGIVLSETVPANTVFNAGASTAGWACAPNGNAGSTCTLPVASLAAGANGSATFAVTVDNPLAGGVTQISNTARIAPPDDNPANDTATDTTPIAAGASVTATKTVAGIALPGSVLTYTAVLSNAGPGPQGDNPGNEFTDVLPAGLALVSANATSGTAVATPGTNTVTWNGAIAAGASVTITIQATVLGSAAGTTVSNQGTISWDSNGDGMNDSSGVTDDPSLGGATDPTATAVPGVSTAVPTLSTAGGAVLAFVLAGLGATFIRFRALG